MVEITEADRLAHREAVAERLKTMNEHAQANAARIRPANGIASDGQKIFWLTRITRSRDSRTAKLLALRGWADAAAKEITPVTACRNGCSDCCHIAVLVSKPEAELIAERTGRKLASPTVQRGGDPRERTSPSYEDIPWGYHNPCSLLVNGRCSIYKDRPMACRTHYNFDDDELLCKVTDSPNNNPVPYWDTADVALTVALVCDEHAQVADIREWFPPEEEDRWPNTTTTNKR